MCAVWKTGMENLKEANHDLLANLVILGAWEKGQVMQHAAYLRE